MLKVRVVAFSCSAGRLPAICSVIVNFFTVTCDLHAVKGCYLHSLEVGQPSVVTSSPEHVGYISSCRTRRLFTSMCNKGPTQYDIGKTYEDVTWIFYLKKSRLSTAVFGQRQFVSLHWKSSVATRVAPHFIAQRPLFGKSISDCSGALIFSQRTSIFPLVVTILLTLVVWRCRYV